MTLLSALWPGVHVVIDIRDSRAAVDLAAGDGWNVSGMGSHDLPRREPLRPTGSTTGGSVLWWLPLRPQPRPSRSRLSGRSMSLIGGRWENSLRYPTGTGPITNSAPSKCRGIWANSPHLWYAFEMEWWVVTVVDSEGREEHVVVKAEAGPEALDKALNPPGDPSIRPTGSTNARGFDTEEQARTVATLAT